MRLEEVRKLAKYNGKSFKRKSWDYSIYESFEFFLFGYPMIQGAYSTNLSKADMDADDWELCETPPPKLKNCPFCGGYDYVDTMKIESGYFRSGCYFCKIWTDSIDDRAKCIEKWNRRA